MDTEPAADETGAQVPGPIVERRAPRPPRPANVRLGWWIAAGVLLFAAVLYIANRPVASSPLQSEVPPPVWGSVTLEGIAHEEATAAGDPKVRSGRWVFTSREDAIPYLLPGQTTTDGTAEYLLTMTGRFHAVNSSDVLPGSQSQGTELTLLVRGVDGAVRGVLINDAAYTDLSRLGSVHNLRIGFHPFGL